jgi:hypothetical protein
MNLKCQNPKCGAIIDASPSDETLNIINTETYIIIKITCPKCGKIHICHIADNDFI